MPRCNSCNKFVSLEELEAEGESPEIESGSVFINVRIASGCAECGTELREANLELEAELPGKWADHDGSVEDHELAAEVLSLERTDRSEGSGRFAKRFLGVECVLEVKCKCGEYAEQLTLTDNIQASAMDDCQ